MNDIFLPVSERDIKFARESKLNIQREIKKYDLDMKIFRKKSNSKTYKGWMIQAIKELRGVGNFDGCALAQTFYKKYLEFEQINTFQFEHWRGKGFIKVFKKPDGFIIEFADKRDKDEIPKITRKEYSREEVNELINSINKLKEYEKIPSRILGETFYKKSWDDIFCDRPNHCRFTHLLNILDFYGVIHYYRSGNIKVIKEVREIQEVLK